MRRNDDVLQGNGAGFGRASENRRGQVMIFMALDHVRDFFTYIQFPPEDMTQIPMFRLWGTPDGQKRRVVYDTGHNIPRTELIKETLNWLDQYLGPIN